jgi:hypothetical protein
MKLLFQLVKTTVFASADWMWYNDGCPLAPPETSPFTNRFPSPVNTSPFPTAEPRFKVAPDAITALPAANEIRFSEFPLAPVITPVNVFGPMLKSDAPSDTP